MTSIPSANFTPRINFGNWLWPSMRHQLFWAPSTSLKTMASAVLFDRQPFVLRGEEDEKRASIRMRKRRRMLAHPKPPRAFYAPQPPASEVSFGIVGLGHGI